MILDRFKALNLSDEDIKKECEIFNEVYDEYIRDDVKTKHISTYIYQNPMDKTKKVVPNNIVKNLKKNDDTYNNHQFNTKYGHKEKEKAFSEKVKTQYSHTIGTSYTDCSSQNGKCYGRKSEYGRG